jgi:4'-phosphopantetheinyl transferase
MSALGTVHVACARAAELPGSLDWLSPQEGERLAGIVALKRREQFLAGRWQMRQLLAQAVGGTPRDWALTAPPDAPPAVEGQRQWHLSISHSGEWIGCAVAHAPLGLDLEAPRRQRDIAGLLALCCTPGEQRMFEGLGEHEREPLFYELWTVKESWLKRRGEWISPRRLAQLEAQPQQGGEVRTWRAEELWLALCAGPGHVRWWSGEPPIARTWRVADPS